MWRYLKEWRRTAGFMLLVLAGVSAFWWAKSQVVTDVFCFRENNKFLDTYLLEVIPFFHSNRVNVIASDASSIVWLRRRDRNPNEPFHSRFEAGSDVLERLSPQADTSNPVILFIPYSSLMIPLTMLAAWLLWKPRRPTTKSPDPAPEIGA